MADTRSTVAGKQLASLRKRIRKRCEVCDVEIIVLKQAKYCSNRCRQRAKYQRQKGVERSARTELYC